MPSRVGEPVIVCVFGTMVLFLFFQYTGSAYTAKFGWYDSTVGVEKRVP